MMILAWSAHYMLPTKTVIDGGGTSPTASARSYDVEGMQWQPPSSRPAGRVPRGCLRRIARSNGRPSTTFDYASTSSRRGV